MLNDSRVWKAFVVDRIGHDRIQHRHAIHILPSPFERQSCLCDKVASDSLSDEMDGLGEIHVAFRTRSEWVVVAGTAETIDSLAQRELHLIDATGLVGAVSSRTWTLGSDVVNWNTSRKMPGATSDKGFTRTCGSDIGP